MSTETAEPTERPKRADARRNRERVLEAAAALFAEQGLKVHMGDVADRAGVGVGTVCRNFPTKEALIEALLTDMITSLMIDAEAALADPDPTAALWRFVESMADLQARSRGLAEEMRTYLGAGAHDLPVKLGLRAAITEIIRRAQAAGAIRDDLGPGDVSLLLSGIAHAASLTGDDAIQRRRHLTIVLDGLRPAHPSALPGRPLSYDDIDRARRRQH